LAKASDLSVREVDKTRIMVEEYEVENEHNCSLVISSNILLYTQLMQAAVGVLADVAFSLLVRNTTQGVHSAKAFNLKLLLRRL
jgi:hypothetical protein